MKSDSGNVLFLILVAIALFIALSYAVTGSMRTGGSNEKTEATNAAAAALIQYASSLSQSVLRLRMSGNCSETTLDFSNSIFKKSDGTPYNTANSNAPSNKSCHLFDAAGAGAIPVPMPVGIRETPLDSAVQGSFRVAQVKNLGTDGVSGTQSANDIIYFIGGISRKGCIAINDVLKVNNPSSEPPVVTFSGCSDMSGGSYTNGSLAGSCIVSEANIDGKNAFCYKLNTGNYYQFIYALIER